jgi:hypothetical protein
MNTSNTKKTLPTSRYDLAMSASEQADPITMVKIDVAGR